MRYAQALKKINQLYPSLSGVKVLELGCSSGRFKRLLEKEGAQVLGVDKEGGDLCLDLNEPLPFKDREFDLVVSLAVLEHLEKPEVFLREVRRVALAGVLTTPHKRSEKVLSLLANLGLINREHIKDHKRYFTQEELRSYGFDTLLFEAGFNILFWFDERRHPVFDNSVYLSEFVPKR